MGNGGLYSIGVDLLRYMLTQRMLPSPEAQQRPCRHTFTHSVPADPGIIEGISVQKIAPTAVELGPRLCASSGMVGWFHGHRKGKPRDPPPRPTFGGFSACARRSHPMSMNDEARLFEIIIFDDIRYKTQYPARQRQRRYADAKLNSSPFTFRHSRIRAVERGRWAPHIFGSESRVYTHCDGIAHNFSRTHIFADRPDIFAARTGPD